jgi:hypothetical protein
MSFKNINNMHVYILLLLITNQNKIARMLLIFWNTKYIFGAATSIKYSHGYALISQRNGTMKQLRALGGNMCFVNLLLNVRKLFTDGILFSTKGTISQSYWK